MSAVSETLAELQLVARNSAATSDNHIHADAGAQAMGFKAALVPGNAVYRYIETAVADVLGPAFAESGGAEVKFRRPAHDGDRLRVTVESANSGRHTKSWPDDSKKPRAMATALPR